MRQSYQKLVYTGKHPHISWVIFINCLIIKFPSSCPGKWLSLLNLTVLFWKLTLNQCQIWTQALCMQIPKKQAFKRGLPCFIHFYSQHLNLGWGTLKNQIITGLSASSMAFLKTILLVVAGSVKHCCVYYTWTYCVIDLVISSGLFVHFPFLYSVFTWAHADTYLFIIHLGCLFASFIDNRQWEREIKVMIWPRTVWLSFIISESLSQSLNTWELDPSMDHLEINWV